MDNEMIFSDKEYVIMSEIEENNTLTQRDLSSKLGVSVSTVNVLLNKMIKEGLIKINHVSKRQVLYMLTPKGLLEKAHKTTRYLKGHYRIIFETKEKIKSVLGDLALKYDVIFILMPEDELGEIIKVAVKEYQELELESAIRIVNEYDVSELEEYNSSVLIYLAFDERVVSFKISCDTFDLMKSL